MKRFFAIFAKLPPYLNTAVVALIIGYLTLVPHPLPEDTPELFPQADKVVHAIMFWALGVAIYFDTYRRRVRVMRPMNYDVKMAILAINILAGGVIEIAQLAMGLGRGADLYDFAADCVGALVAYMVAPRLVGWALSGVKWR